jgi:hypothetical protein
VLNQASALGLTLLIEAPIVLAASARGERKFAWRLAAALLPSCLTHPFAWHAMGNFGAHDYATGLLLIELIVIAVETALLRLLIALPLRASLLLSIAANTASTLFGLLLA